MTPSFNEKAQKVTEVEIKFLVPAPEGGGVDRTAFDQIDRYFRDKGWVKLEKSGQSLLTRQLDTPDRKLLERDVTIRVRGSCKNQNIKTVEEADICVKMGKTQDESGAVRRGEYEARIKHFERADMKALLAKYPKTDYPELHDALVGIDQSELREFFRIDCIRNRYVVELPEETTGLKGKRFVGELLLDDVAFVLDLPELRHPLVFHHDLEIECETLFKPCDYDNDPRAKDYVSTPMGKAETNKGMEAVREAILNATDNKVTINTRSKAERGFDALDAELENLRGKIEASADRASKRSKLQSAFHLSHPDNDNDAESAKLHKLLSKNFAYLFRQNRPIASHMEI